MLAQENLLIDGKLVPAASGKVFETLNPATEEVLGTAADAAAEDLDAAIGAARRAFDSGALVHRSRPAGPVHPAAARCADRAWPRSSAPPRWPRSVRR